MSVVRLQGRPRRGPTSVGRDKIIFDALEILRRGECFTTRKELATKLGITPALINYYFGKTDFLLEAIADVLFNYSSRFHETMEGVSTDDFEDLDEALSIIATMYANEGRLLQKYQALLLNDTSAFNVVRVMKKELQRVFEARCDSSLATVYSETIWGACASASNPNHIGLCTRIAKHLVESLSTSTSSECCGLSSTWKSGSRPWIGDAAVRR